MDWSKQWNGIKAAIKRSFAILGEASQGHVLVPTTRSTQRYLIALAAANGLSVDELLAKYVASLADAAGRRPGTWEATPGVDFISNEGLSLPGDLDCVCVNHRGGFTHGFVRFGSRFCGAIANGEKVATHSLIGAKSGRHA